MSFSSAMFANATGGALEGQKQAYNVQANQQAAEREQGMKEMALALNLLNQTGDSNAAAATQLYNSGAARIGRPQVKALSLRGGNYDVELWNGHGVRINRNKGTFEILGKLPPSDKDQNAMMNADKRTGIQAMAANSLVKDREESQELDRQRAELDRQRAYIDALNKAGGLDSNVLNPDKGAPMANQIRDFSANVLPKDSGAKLDWSPYGANDWQNYLKNKGKGKK